MKRPLFGFCMLVAGALFYAQLPIGSTVKIVFAVLMGTVLGIWAFRKREKAFLGCVVVAILFAAGLSFGFERLVYRPVADLYGIQQEIQFVVADYPERFENGSVVEGILAKPDIGLPIWKIRVRVRLEDASPELIPGDNIKCTALLKKPGRSDQRFDWTGYYRGKGLFLYAVQQGECHIQHPDKIPIRFWPQKWAKSLSECIEKTQVKHAGFIKALLLGDRADLNFSTEQVLRQTGMGHIAVVSGMHVSFLIAFLCFFARGSKLQAVIGIPALFVFMAITGFTPSVIRAGVMHICALLAAVFYRESDSLTALGFSFVLILLFNPYAVRDVGLLLSFGATLGILLFAARIQQALSVALQSGKVRKLIISLAAVSLSAQVFTAPVSLIAFGTISLIAPIANVLVLPVFSLIFIICIIGLILVVLLPQAKGLFMLASLLLEGVFHVLTWIAKIPYSYVQSDNFYALIFLVICYMLLLLLLYGQPDRKILRAAGVGVAAAFLSCMILSMWTAEKTARIQVLDAEGRTIVLQHGNSCALVDCGSNKMGGNIYALKSFLLDNNITQIDAVFLSDDSPYCSGGLDELLKYVPVKRVILSPGLDATLHTKDFQSAKEQPENVDTAVDGQKIVAAGFCVKINSVFDQGIIYESQLGDLSVAIASADNPYLIVKTAQTKGIKCDILVMDQAAVQKIDPELLSVFRYEEAIYVSRQYFDSDQRPAAGMYTADTGNITVEVFERK